MKKKIENKEEIIIYKDKSNKVNFNVKIKKDSIWISQAQMAELFETERSVITKHLRNIFESGELKEKSNVQKMHIPLSDKPVNFYNLDAIISVGYRVNSKKATDFRIWATEKLRNYLVKGYVVNQKKLKEGDLKELEQIFVLTKKLIAEKQLDEKETEGVLKVITDYTNSWIFLQRYDEGSLTIPKKKEKVKYDIDYDFAIKSIEKLKLDLIKKKEASSLFGKQRNQMMQDILGNIRQSFNGKELYPSIEERAAHLLYFTIKDHPFFDGNKRIASFLFILFLKKNKYFHKNNGERKINDNGLVALALLIAQSNSKDKDGIINLIINFIN
ncbi:MAG TPA: virulence protein RhuM/Fic/DOC family protein [Candidatus Pacearchaeota archaeon]|nr:virulence protein RhuM/Fic/DOC family protein [Candidatus Pacearchaeota archaeon]HQM24608.1 virulence protein RhuM/Fic/DOC family protein [Candidatus Pacearchaeota archaeon]